MIKKSLAIIAASLFCSSAQAQYFGQNKIRYKSFDFKILKTDHSDIRLLKQASSWAR